MFMNCLTKGLLAGIAIARADQCRRLSVQLVKIEAAQCYLHGVRMTRLWLIGLLKMGLALELIGVGLLFFHAGLFIWLPWTVEAKAILAMLLGLSYVAIGCVVLRVFLAEKTWLKKSGVVAMLKAARAQRNTE